MTSRVAKEKASNARSEYSFRLPNNRAAFFDGVKVGVPIGMGDFVVAFALGVAVGAVLSPQWVSALGVALFGMFLAVIVPPCRKNKVVAALVASSFIFSFLMTRTPILSGLSEGSRVVVLTLILASLAAIAFPVDEDIADELNADSASLETDEQQC